MPRRREAEQQELSSHGAKRSEPPASPSFTALFSLVHLNHRFSGNPSPQRGSIRSGRWQQAAQAFCLLPMKAKNRAARSASKTPDDRYDTETTSCFHPFTLHNTKPLEMGFSRKQKAQLVRRTFGQPKVSI